MVVVPLGVLIAAKMVPQEVFEECRQKAREFAEGEKAVSRLAAVVVVCLFVCVSHWPSFWRYGSSEAQLPRLLLPRDS